MADLQKNLIGQSVLQEVPPRYTVAMLDRVPEKTGTTSSCFATRCPRSSLALLLVFKSTNHHVCRTNDRPR